VTRDQRLTALAVTRAKAKRDKAGRAVRTERPDRLCRGLYLVTQPSGAKSWAVRYRHGGKTRKLTLGAALGADEEAAAEPTIGAPLTLAGARKLAAEAMHQVDLGRDPAGEKAEHRSVVARSAAETFRAIAESYLKREGKTLRTADDRRADLERLVFPALGSIPIAAIRRGDVVRLLDSIEDNHGATMADRTLALVKRLCNWHAARSDDFRSPIVRGMARTKPKERARERTLTDDEIRAVWAAAGNAGRFGWLVRFILLTAARRTEAAAMRLSELKDGVWALPADRNKTKVELLRPLSGAAQALLQEIERAGPFVFGVGDHPLAGFSKPKAALDQASDVAHWTLHDLRRTARSLMSRAGVRPDIAELCLGHVVGGVRGTYDRYEYLEEKAQAFEALAGQIERILHPRGNVAQLRPAARSEA
jgi:integrase